jgi:hypothetical protein
MSELVLRTVCNRCRVEAWKAGRDAAQAEFKRLMRDVLPLIEANAESDPNWTSVHFALRNAIADMTRIPPPSDPACCRPLPQAAPGVEIGPPGPGSQRRYEHCVRSRDPRPVRECHPRLSPGSDLRRRSS